MKRIKVAAGILNQTALDWDNNQGNIIAAINEAKAQDASVLCLPEMCIPGYGCEDALQSKSTQELSLDVLQQLLEHTKNIAVCVGLPLRYRNGLFNAVALLVDGVIAGFVAKRFLAGDGLHYEPRWFKPWPVGVCTEVTLRGKSYPLGDYHFDCGGVKLGFEICEDAWVSNRPGIRLAQRAVDIILNPSASHFAFNKLSTRQRFVLEGSRAFGVTYAYANLVGNAAGRAIYDGGALIASGGELLASGPRFCFDNARVTCALVDIDLARSRQQRLTSFVPDFESEGDCVKVSLDFAVPSVTLESTTPEAWELSPYLKEEEFTRAITLALFDYLRKSRSQGFVVSLSGGADSAAVACLCALTFERALAELGPEGLAQRLGYIHDFNKNDDLLTLIGKRLACVYQSTRNSGSVTHEAARGVAEAIGAEFMTFDVDTLVQGYHRIIEASIGRQLQWEKDDIALQNIQARVRSPGIWMLANIRRALLLSTSNRSEAAVGYATMDGDTSGGLSPIAGIDKAFLRQWLQWLESKGPKDLQSIPALDKINAQAPTAELRPSEKHQTDEDDLMPYALLDAIERAAIRDKRSPKEVLCLIEMSFSDYSRSELILFVRRFFNLWCRNQWKRERYAPSFHVDDENLDPKTWCRFPILSGGFARELKELDE